jgi:hypothetical protein
VRLVAATRTSRPPPTRRAPASETTTAAAAPSPVAQQDSRVNGSATIGAASTASTVSGVRYWA